MLGSHQGTRQPTHCCFDRPTGSYALPGAIIPPTQEWNDIRADMISRPWPGGGVPSGVKSSMHSCRVTIALLIIGPYQLDGVACGNPPSPGPSASAQQLQQIQIQPSPGAPQNLPKSVSGPFNPVQARPVLFHPTSEPRRCYIAPHES
jgi:hypothetical protein